MKSLGPTSFRRRPVWRARKRIVSAPKVESSRATYRNVVGSAPIDLTVPAVPAALLPDNKENAVRLAVTQKLSVLAALYDVDAGKDGLDRVWGELLPEVSERFRRSGFRWFGTGYDEEHGSRQNRCQNASVSSRRCLLPRSRGQTNRVRTTLRCGSSPTRRGRRDQRVGKFDFRKARVRSFKSQINASRIALKGWNVKTPSVPGRFGRFGRGAGARLARQPGSRPAGRNRRRF